MAIEKPSWLRDALASGWLNWYKGSWWHFGFIDLPPFSLTPGLWIENSIDWVVGFLNWFAAWIANTWAKAVEAWDRATEALGKVGEFFVNIGSWIKTHVLDFWNAIKPYVLGAVDSVKTWFLDTLPTKLSEFWKAAKAEFPDWRAIVAQALFPFAPILTLWEEYKGTIVTFSTNPIGYVEAVVAKRIGPILIAYLKEATWLFLAAVGGFLERMWDEEAE